MEAFFPYALGMIIFTNFAVIGGLFFLKAFTRFLFAISNERPDDLTSEVAVWTGFTASFIAAGGWFLASFERITSFFFYFAFFLFFVVIYFWNKSDYYTSGAISHMDYERMRVRGRLYGNRIATISKRVLQTSVLFTFLASVSLLYTGFSADLSLVLVGLGIVLLVPTIVVGFLTRNLGRVRFLQSPRPPRLSQFRSSARTLATKLGDVGREQKGRVALLVKRLRRRLRDRLSKTSTR